MKPELPPRDKVRLRPTEKNLRRSRGLAQEMDGFSSLDTVVLDADDLRRGESKKVQIVNFHPLSLEAPCPCGSGRAFGECCQLLGSKRVFALNPDGNGYSPLMFYVEVWQPWKDREVLSDALKRREEFLLAEDSENRALWNYRGERPIPYGAGLMVFGTIELTADTLKIEAVSRVRYESLRRKIEDALGEPLPPGKRSVLLPTPGADGDILAAEPEEGMPILEEYRVLRERLREIMPRAMDEILSDELEHAARDLHMLGPGKTMVFDDEGEMAIVIDYALFETKRHGEPVIQHFMKRNPPRDREEELIYAAFSNSFISIFQVERISSGVLTLQDLVIPERRPTLVDVGLGSTASPGHAIYARLLPFPRFHTTSGWLFAVTEERIQNGIVAKYLDRLSEVPRKKQAAAGILFFKDYGFPGATGADYTIL